MERKKHCSRSEKSVKQNIKHYCPHSLLPICGKIFERLIFNEMFRFFISNNLISPNQWDFKPGDSSINQLLSVTLEIYILFDGLEVRAVFLHTSKAFDNVWREGIIFTLMQNSISGDLLHILSNFLIIESNELYLMHKIRFGPMFTLEFHKYLS